MTGNALDGPIRPVRRCPPGAMAVTVELPHYIRRMVVSQSGAFEQTHQRSGDHAVTASEGHELDRRLTPFDQCVKMAT